MFYDDNSQLKLAWDYVQFTGNNIFLTGKAGTGKTTFLRNIRQSTLKRAIVVAPTGVAALNAGGVTIHSFFQLPFGPQLPAGHVTTDYRQKAAGNQKVSREKINIIRSLDLLIIDEISMVRADLLDAIDQVLRRYRNRGKPFGGVQLLMIGDLQQLAPIVKDDEWDLLRPFYDTPFFFSSLALKMTVFTAIELKHIYRQNDTRFIELLNKVRENIPDQATIDALNERYDPRFDSEKNPGYITLTTHNYQSQQINEKRLEKIRSHKYVYKAEITGSFPEYSFPTLSELELKKGAQVMFVKNDSSASKRYYNGKIGVITGIDDEKNIRVECPGDKEEIQVTPEEWNNCNYALDEKSNEIVENVIGTFRQIPLKLAWAITIHKSQGLTFDKAIIDANAAFAHGQVYVALSRCTSLAGLVLSSKIEPHSIRSDSSVIGFTKGVENNQPDESQLLKARQEYDLSLLFELFDFKPVQTGLSYCLKLAKEHASSLDIKFIEEINAILERFVNEVASVSERFQVQLYQYYQAEPDLDKNTRLQERISKACIYFDDKFETILLPLWRKHVIETDNKAVKKSFLEAIDRLKEETRQKQSCIIESKSGFSVRKYMETRAVSGIEKQPEYHRQDEDKVPSHIPHPVLYTALKKWRSNKAEESDVPEYQILNQKSLVELVKYLPRTEKGLLSVSGIGKVKAKFFGEELIEMISAYCKENGVEQNSTVLSEKRPHRPEPKPDTKSITLNLFIEGKTVEEIAGIRHLTVSTIENHLLHFIKSGELAIKDVVSAEKIKRIISCVEANDNQQLGIIKEALGDEISWGELRMVAASLKNNQG